MALPFPGKYSMATFFMQFGNQRYAPFKAAYSKNESYPFFTVFRPLEGGQKHLILFKTLLMGFCHRFEINLKIFGSP